MKKSYLFAAVAILFWSTVSVVTKLLLGSMNSFQVLCVSSLFASLALLVVNLVTGNIRKLAKYTPRDYLTTVLIGIPGTFLYYVFFYTGTSKMLASQAFIVNYLWPIMSVIFACIILKEEMTPRKGIAIAMSFLGVVIVTGGDLANFSMDTALGAMFCVLGAVSYGIFTAFNQKYGYDKRISMMIFYFTSFVLTLIINAASGQVPAPDLFEVVGLAWNGVLTMALANTSWMIALESGKTAKISNLAYMTPFLSLIWTTVILREPFRITSLIGLMVIVLGILIQLKDKKKS